MTRDSELEQIFTWEYFHKNESGQVQSSVGWIAYMAIARSLHLSQQPGRKLEGSVQEEAKSGNLSGPTVNEEFVLQALCKPLNAALPTNSL